ncbi:MAG TPA: hypothetical protein VLM43_14880 [Desulfobacterales bacterium]|nr:hypothetical protein [Desulfobacterales bacterium]
MYTNSEEFLHVDNLRIEVELEMKQKKGETFGEGTQMNDRC